MLLGLLGLGLQRSEGLGLTCCLWVKRFRDLGVKDIFGSQRANREHKR